MQLADVDHIIESCVRILNETGTKETMLESYLAKFLLVCIHAAYENEYQNIVKRRASRNNDNYLTSFVTKKVDTRSLLISNIKGNILKSFDDALPGKFADMLTNSPAVQRYENIIVNRNLAAHGANIRMSFDEIVDAFKSSSEVLAAFSSVLNSNVSSDV